MTENVEKIITFAPGEGNNPLGIFKDEDEDFLSFPAIYCGKTRPDNKDRTTPVHYSTICKWQLRSQDGRVFPECNKFGLNICPPSVKST